MTTWDRVFLCLWSCSGLECILYTLSYLFISCAAKYKSLSPKWIDMSVVCLSGTLWQATQWLCSTTSTWASPQARQNAGMGTRVRVNIPCINYHFKMDTHVHINFRTQSWMEMQYTRVVFHLISTWWMSTKLDKLNTMLHFWSESY